MLALLPRLPFIPPLRPAGEFSTLTLLQARYAILQAVPGKLHDIDAFDSPSIRLTLAFHSPSTRVANTRSGGRSIPAGQTASCYAYFPFCFDRGFLGDF